MNKTAQALLERAKKRATRVIIPWQDLKEQGFAALYSAGLNADDIETLASDSGIPSEDIAASIAASLLHHSSASRTPVNHAPALNVIDAKLDEIRQVLLEQRDYRLHKEWYSVSETARLTGYQPYTIRQCCNLGRIRDDWKAKDIRTGKWRLSVEAVRWIQNHGLPPA